MVKCHATWVKTKILRPPLDDSGLARILAFAVRYAAARRRRMRIGGVVKWWNKMIFPVKREVGLGF
ncbi:hypothetical protein QJS10_CPB17g00024 [Acorus calamus]|uniref:Uncharacterized protein n=1 Tax=Acorus calamus TaxID=4465 RepID=A0AAV9CWQ3_ACOCL|nr:hypothetical protein QJS10_CPB17g00024 [Acorus calamus]